MTRSSLAVAAALAAVAIGATACSSNSSDTSATSSSGSTSPSAATTTQTQTQTQSVSPSPTTSTAATKGGGSGSSGSSGSSQCAESQLRASIDPRALPGNGTKNGSGKLTHGVLVDFKNKSTSTCELTGYPGAAIQDANGKQIQQAKRTLRGSLGGLPSGRKGYSSVKLAPGKYAAALLEGVDTQEVGAAQAGCEGSKYPHILVTPPNTKIAVPFTVGWPKCYSFDVHPVRSLPSAP